MYLAKIHVYTSFSPIIFFKIFATGEYSLRYRKTTVSRGKLKDLQRSKKNVHDIQCTTLITVSLIHKQTTNRLRFHGDTGISRGYAKVSLIHAWRGKQDFRENLYVCLLLYG